MDNRRINIQRIAARWLRWRIGAVALSALLLGACGGSGEDSGPSYVAVVDAGSSGSRIYLYETETRGDFGPIRMVFDARRATLPTLASFESHPSDAGAGGVGPLLGDLTQYLSAHRITPHEVAVSVLGTGGMRKVGSVEADQIYSSVKAVVRAAGYQATEARTITGEAEGLYSWADVNYLEGVFQNGGEPYGLIEIGGASAQVAFVARDTFHPNVITWKINGTPYPVLSVSFLGLGTDEARKAMILSPHPGAGSAMNACFTSGYLFGAHPGDPAPAPGVHTLSGAFDYEACNGLYEGVIQPFNVPRVSSVGGFSESKFLLVGGFVEGALTDWGMPKSGPTVLANNVRSYCQGGSWTDFLATFGQYAPQKYLQSLCANSTYANAFLYGNRGMSLRADQASPFKNEGAASTWTRGYVVMTRYGVRQN